MELLATNPQKQQIHRLKRQYGWDEETYRELINQYSGGRTTSSKDMTRNEAKRFIRKFINESSIISHERNMCLPLVKAIYAVSLEISFLNKNYPSNERAEVEMNKSKINSFVMSHGVVRKPVSKQNYEELIQTLKQLKSIADKEK